MESGIWSPHPSGAPPDQSFKYYSAIGILEGNRRQRKYCYRGTVVASSHRGPAGQSFKYSLAMCYLGENMETTIDTTAAVARFATFTLAYTLTLGMVV